MKGIIFTLLFIFTLWVSVSSQTTSPENHAWRTGAFTSESLHQNTNQKRITKPATGSSTIPLMLGWPVKVGLWPQYPVAADLDQDGKKEVIIADRSGYLHVFTCDGQYYADAWPIRLGNSLSAPAIADVDQDGALEIVVVEMHGFGDYWPNGRVHVLEADGTHLAGWPFLLDGAHNWINSVSIGDINQDGTLEIITATGLPGSVDGTTIYPNKIYALNPDGTPLPGWPVEPDSSSGMERVPRSPLVLVDLDQDGYLEILSGFLNKNPNSGQNAIFALRYDGTTVRGFPIRTESWNYSLASADMHGDGLYEIYCHGMRYNRWGNRDYSWKEQKQVISKLAFADINQDGLPELIYGSGKVHVVDSEGNELSGWPAPTREDGDIVDGNPVAGDIDGDGDIEILIGTHNTNNVFAWHHNGRRVTGFPVSTGGSNPRIAISDLDGDGDMELISACEDSLVYVWDIPATGPCTNLEWPMFQHDERHTGVYPNRSTAVEDEPYMTPATFQLSQNYPNPFHGATRIPYSLSKRTEISLTVYDLQGRTVCNLVHVMKNAGSHMAVWQGKIDEGEPAGSGVYLIVLRAGETVKKRKVILVK